MNKKAYKRFPCDHPVLFITWTHRKRFSFSSFPEKRHSWWKGDSRLAIITLPSCFLRWALKRNKLFSCMKYKLDLITRAQETDIKLAKTQNVQNILFRGAWGERGIHMRCWCEAKKLQAQWRNWARVCLVTYILNHWLAILGSGLPIDGSVYVIIHWSEYPPTSEFLSRIYPKVELAPNRNACVQSYSLQHNLKFQKTKDSLPISKGLDE